MSDYIKREDAIKELKRAHKKVLGYAEEKTLTLAEEIIDDMPSADVVEVVRCKDCKWWDGNDCKARDIDVVDVDDFCSYGERKCE